MVNLVLVKAIVLHLIEAAQNKRLTSLHRILQLVSPAADKDEAVRAIRHVSGWVYKQGLPPITSLIARDEASGAVGEGFWKTGTVPYIEDITAREMSLRFYRQQCFNYYDEVSAVSDKMVKRITDRVNTIFASNKEDLKLATKEMLRAREQGPFSIVLADNQVIFTTPELMYATDKWMHKHLYFAEDNSKIEECAVDAVTAVLSRYQHTETIVIDIGDKRDILAMALQQALGEGEAYHSENINELVSVEVLCGMGSAAGNVFSFVAGHVDVTGFGQSSVRQQAFDKGDVSVNVSVDMARGIFTSVTNSESIKRLMLKVTYRIIPGE